MREIEDTIQPAPKTTTNVARRVGGVVILMIIAVAGVLLLQDALDRRDRPYSREAPLVVTRDESLTIEENIINKLSNQRALVLQRGIGTVPVISSTVIARIIGRLTDVARMPLAHFAVNFPGLLQRVTRRYRVLEFGGLILYQTNLENVRTLEDYKKYVASVRQQFTFNVFVKIIDPQHPANETYEVQVSPFVVADCDLSYAHFKYCRGLFENDALPDAPSLTDRQEKIRTIIKEFSQIGLNSTLSPEVDLDAPQTIESIVDLAKVASLTAHESGMVPVLKHFMYDRKLGDTHDSSFYNPLTESQFRNGLAPYVAVEQLGIPYFIMVSHHRLPLDPRTPLPLSVTARDFIRSRFSNAITMSDEIKMAGLQEGKNLHDLVKDLKTDSFLFHSGNLTFSVSEIIRGLEDSDPVESARSVKRLLLLKQRLGLLKIRKAN